MADVPRGDDIVDRVAAAHPSHKMSDDAVNAAYRDLSSLMLGSDVFQKSVGDTHKPFIMGGHRNFVRRVQQLRGALAFQYQNRCWRHIVDSIVLAASASEDMQLDLRGGNPGCRYHS